MLQADDRAKATEFVTKYDEAMSTQHGQLTVHRVSHYLASEDIGCLSGHLREYAGGGPMHPKLRTEVTAYQLCI